MSDWKKSNYVDPNNAGTWVYYEDERSPKIFPNIHISRSVDNSNRDHTATDDRQYYYFGVTKTVNNNRMPRDIRTNLENAWIDYFRVN